MKPCYYKVQNNCVNLVPEDSFLCEDCKLKQYPKHPFKKVLEERSKLSKYERATVKQLQYYQSVAQVWLISHVGHPAYKKAQDRFDQICDELKRRGY